MEYLAPESSFAELCKNSWALWATVAATRPIGSGNNGQETDRGKITHEAQIERLVNIVIVREIE